MRIYKVVNPENFIYIIVANDKFEAIQGAKKIDLYKWTESEYKVLVIRKKKLTNGKL
jgi:hypothetical protein